MFVLGKWKGSIKVMLYFVQFHIMILIVVGLLITSGFDNKLLSWDVRTKKASSLSRSLAEEIESMSVSGFKVTVGIGTSAHVFDLRNFDKPTLSIEPCSGTQLRCVSSIPYAEGMYYQIYMILFCQPWNTLLCKLVKTWNIQLYWLVIHVLKAMQIVRNILLHWLVILQDLQPDQWMDGLHCMFQIHQI